MKTIIGGILLAFLCGSLSGQGQDFRPLTPAIVYLEIDQQMWGKFATNDVELWYRFPGKTDFVRPAKRESGTGFLISHHHRGYIVTAAHVVGDPKHPDTALNTGNVFLIDTNRNRVALSLEDIRGRVRGARWFIHSSADLAIHPFVYPTNTWIENKFMDASSITTNELEILSSVAALGFPVQLGTIGAKISPIATECKIASWLTVVPTEDTNLLFLVLDKALAQGYSGSPFLALLPVSSQFQGA